MKNLFILILSLSFFSCNNHKKTSNPVRGNDTTSVKPDAETGKTETFLEELRNLSPLDEEQLKALIPASVMGATVTNPSVTTSMGAGLASGEYIISDTSKISINIYDCAGPGGAGVYNLQFVNMLDVNIENENDFTKTIEFNGSKAYEQCQKQSIDCSFTWFSGNRYLVSLESGNIPATELIKEAKKLVIK